MRSVRYVVEDRVLHQDQVQDRVGVQIEDRVLSRVEDLVWVPILDPVRKEVRDHA